ncbi:hypothetical protein AB0A94_10015 [Streptomyces sp. NPDC044984]|uniref:hypothetical protein n=1 Tax=Streptomyces sp. NPDC044984 TaxID=3154335 RepID=UPI003405E480
MAAKIPGERGFTTEGEPARDIVRRCLAAGLPATWVTADEAYGQNWHFRRLLEQGVWPGWYADAGAAYPERIRTSSYHPRYARESRAFADAESDECDPRGSGGGRRRLHRLPRRTVPFRPADGRWCPQARHGEQDSRNPSARTKLTVADRLATGDGVGLARPNPPELLRHRSWESPPAGPGPVTVPRAPTGRCSAG